MTLNNSHVVEYHGTKRRLRRVTIPCTLYLMIKWLFNLLLVSFSMREWLLSTKLWTTLQCNLYMDATMKTAFVIRAVSLAGRETIVTKVYLFTILNKLLKHALLLWWRVTYLLLSNFKSLLKYYKVDLHFLWLTCSYVKFELKHGIWMWNSLTVTGHNLKRRMF